MYSDPSLLWLGQLVKDAWKQLRLQLTGNVNTAFEEEVKLCSALGHSVVQPVLQIPPLEQSHLPNYCLVSNLLYSNKLVDEELLPVRPCVTEILVSAQQRFRLGRGM